MPQIIKGSVKSHTEAIQDMAPQHARKLRNNDDIDGLDPSWRYSESPFLENPGTLRKATSFHHGLRKIPRLKLPTISNSDVGEVKQDKRTRNRFAIAYADKGLLYKSILSTSLPDMPSLTRPSGQPRKFEKLSFSKRILDGRIPPPPSGNQPVVAPVLPVKFPPIKHKIKKQTDKKERVLVDADVFNIVNNTDRSVAYFEHDGNIYINDNNRTWKEGCSCKLCDLNKKEYFDTEKKLEEKRLRKMKNSLYHRERRTSPVKELKDE